MIILALGADANDFERLYVVVGDEIIDGLNIAVGNGVADQFRRLGFCLRRTFASLGIAEGGFLAAFGFEHASLLFTFSFEDRGLAKAFGLEDLSTLFAFRLHLARHAVDQGRAAARCL